MKRALFSLLAGLVSLSLAGCTLSLIATPTPSPTPLVSTPTAFTAPTETPHIPIPDTIIDEVGAPSEIKQFAGSAESLQPMIDAIAKQLGFTPAEGELAGFTVTGAKGEGNYFFVSHDGIVYTLFAHAQGGRFATVKVDGAGKTSDFAIFRMTRFDRDAATVWWGIDDGQGGIIIPPMFEFQLNSDGSITEVVFVEPKSGKSIQVSENTHQIQFESKVLFKLREQVQGTPTEAIPNFYPGLAPTLEQFTEIGSTADISKIIARLRSQPSLLTEGSDPIWTSVAQGNSVAVGCNANYDKIINCAVAASVKVFDQGQWRWLYIVELRNSDGSRGYLTGYIYDPVDQNGTKPYERMVANPTEPFVFLIRRDIVFHPYEEYNKHRPGVSELIEQLLQTQTVPPALEDQIVNLMRS